ncbi:MAG: YdcF family protein [Oscillospiraceae bacterium]|nr:YdcF family protein [Oscillospiraceae bacterium]
MKKYLIPALLVLIGLGMDIFFTGTSYLACTLYFIAAVIVLFRLLGKKLRRVFSLLLALGVLYFIFVEVPIIGAASGDRDFEAEYVIVLGALVRGEVPSAAMTERCTAALDYMNAHPNVTVIVSGGQGDSEDISEAEAMYRWLVGRGADAGRIVLEDSSTSTKENLEFSFDIIRSLGGDPGRDTAVVTSEYHIYRAKLIALDLGAEIGGIPARTTHPSVKINYFIREAFGVTYKWVFG